MRAYKTAEQQAQLEALVRRIRERRQPAAAPAPQPHRDNDGFDDLPQCDPYLTQRLEDL